MHYTAIITREGRQWLAEFPDAPGCQTFADREADLEASAREALEGWLEAHLESGQVPPEPKPRRRWPAAARKLVVEVDPGLAVAIQLRRARLASGLKQGELAERAGVSQQQIAKLERPGENPTIRTLVKVAAAMGAALDVVVAVAPAPPAKRLKATRPTRPAARAPRTAAAR